MNPLMENTGSYVSDGHVRGLAGEIERLHEQAELTWEAERRHLQSLGLCDGQRLLELGCGPGSFTRLLADWLPNSSIVGLDCDARMLTQARLRLAGHTERISFVHDSAEETKLPDGSFDVVIARYVMQHAPDPQAVAQEARRLLRPGGLLVVIDADGALWGVAEPVFPEFRTLHSVRGKAQAERGGNWFIGRRLGRILRQTGFARVGLDVFAVDSDDVGLAATDVHLNPDQLLPLVADGHISLEDFVRAKFLHQRFLDSTDAFVLMIGFIAWGRKP
ncbi:MAG TPA: methyltransferase domain-containing protein [Planctomycetaceae bacterium]|jgi:SAM-dependent methyltransferase